MLKITIDMTGFERRIIDITADAKSVIPPFTHTCEIECWDLVCMIAMVIQYGHWIRSSGLIIEYVINLVLCDSRRTIMSLRIIEQLMESFILVNIYPANNFQFFYIFFHNISAQFLIICSLLYHDRWRRNVLTLTTIVL